MDTALLWVIPFAALLISIAVAPLISSHWWEKNYTSVTLSLASITVIQVLFVDPHPHALVHSLHEYFSFIVLVGSLYIISGGIHVNVKGESDPLMNCAFLMTAALLANVFGTTGASMVFIRPWIRMNKHRIAPYHIIFFIFIVSNIGGALTPIGDPPLFLGYLKGIPFFWVVENLWQIWVVEILILLLVFFVFDTINFKKTPAKLKHELAAHHEEWRFLGGHNIVFLLVVIGSIFINKPLFVRELVMIAAAFLSYRMTPRDIHKQNEFNFLPIKEVAILFLGIFVTMIPALSWLEHNAESLGIRSAGQFFWATGILSGVLDNAPTYLNFLSAACGLFYQGQIGQTGFDAVKMLLMAHPDHIKAISIGAVFFGAMTYIGNGPNFLVKSIAQHAKVKTPSFFGYITHYSLPILLPSFVLIWFLFFRS